MSESIYAPPEADVVAPLEESEPRYYVVGPTKFMLLSVATFGFYFHYWFWRNWNQVKKADGDDSWPIARAIFYIFFTHSLFSDVDDHLKERDPDYSWPSMTIATLFVILTVVNRLLDRALPEEMITGGVILFSASLWFVLPALLVPAQKAINMAAGDPDASSNSKLTAANYIWLLLGLVMWLLVGVGLLGIFYPELLE